MRFPAIGLLLVHGMTTVPDPRPGGAAQGPGNGTILAPYSLQGTVAGPLWSPLGPPEAALGPPPRRRRDASAPLPSMMTRARTYRVEAGATAHLHCQLHSLGQFVVLWKEAGRVVSAGSLLVRKDARFRLEVKGSSFGLAIDHVAAKDAGKYRCEVDIMGRPLAIDHTLEVLEAPQVAAREGVVRLRAGQDYTLRCSAHGRPNPRILWTKQTGTTLPPLAGLSLPLGPASRASAGLYTCTATNGVGSPATATVRVEVEAPPEVALDQQWTGAGAGGGALAIHCRVLSNPPSQVTWFKDSSKIFETDRVLMTRKGDTWSLKVAGPLPEDFGNYTCRAVSRLGSARASAAISGRPSPLVFTSPSLNHNLAQYELTWRTESFAPVTAYKLRFRLAKADNGTGPGLTTDWSEVAVPGPGGEAFSAGWSYTFPFLQSGSVYDVIGLARNEYGWGPPSPTFTFYNKGVDYSTQQIKYKEAGGQEEVGEQQQEKVFKEKPLLMDRSYAVAIVPMFFMHTCVLISILMTIY